MRGRTPLCAAVCVSYRRRPPADTHTQNGVRLRYTLLRDDRTQQSFGPSPRPPPARSFTASASQARSCSLRWDRYRAPRRTRESTLRFSTVGSAQLAAALGEGKGGSSEALMGMLHGELSEAEQGGCHHMFSWPRRALHGAALNLRSTSAQRHDRNRRDARTHTQRHGRNSSQRQRAPSTHRSHGGPGYTAASSAATSILRHR